MPRYIKSDYNQFVSAGTTKTLHSGAGLIRAFIANCSVTAAQITLYDNTAGSGNILMVLNVSSYAPLVVILPQNYPIKFSTGLTVTAAVGTSFFAITEV